MITSETVDRLAHLARLELNEQETEAMQKELNKMVEMVDSLKMVDTSGVKPLTHLVAECALRDDVVKGQLPRKEALKNACSADDEFILVAKAVKNPNK